MHGNQSSGSVAGLRLRGSYALAKVHVFDLQFNGRLRFAKAENDIGKELQIVAGYRYRFDIDPGKIKSKSLQRKKERRQKRNEKRIRYEQITPGW